MAILLDEWYRVVADMADIYIVYPCKKRIVVWGKMFAKKKSQKQETLYK